MKTINNALSGLAVGALMLFACALLCVSPASAAPLYGHVTVGQATSTEVSGINLSDDLSYGVGVGAQLGKHFRLEVGASRISADTQYISASANDYSATVFYDQPVSEHASLFVGGGFDYLTARASYGPFSADGDGTGWHLTGGAAYRASDHVTLEASANYVDADLSIEGFDANAQTTVFSLGARFTR